MGNWDLNIWMHWWTRGDFLVFHGETSCPASNEAWNPNSKAWVPSESRSTHFNWDPLMYVHSILIYMNLWVPELLTKFFLIPMVSPPEEASNRPGWGPVALRASKLSARRWNCGGAADGAGSRHGRLRCSKRRNGGFLQWWYPKLSKVIYFSQIFHETNHFGVPPKVTEVIMLLSFFWTG